MNYNINSSTYMNIHNNEKERSPIYMNTKSSVGNVLNNMDYSKIYDICNTQK